MVDIERVVSILVSGYPGMNLSRDLVRNFLRCYPDNWVICGDSVALFFRLSDESFCKVKCGYLDITEPGVVRSLLDESGKHIHVFSLVGNGLSDIRRLSRMLKGVSLSWFRPDMSDCVSFARR